jgi:HAMP domain-containing protein/two-component sensor histidine kinase
MPKGRIVSVGTRLAAATLAVLVVAMGIAYVQVSAHERGSLLAAKEDAGTMFARLFAAGLVAPMTFGDDRSAQEQAALLLAADDAIYGAAWSMDGEEATGPLRRIAEVRRSEFTPAPAALRADVRVQRGPERMILDATGKSLGVAQVVLSLHKENAAIRVLERRTLVGSVVLAVGVAALLVALTRALIVRRLARLANAAKELEEGKPIHLDVGGADEVGALARAFSTMTDAIATREQRISERNRDMRRVLDNVAEGFLTVAKDGVMSDERSRILDEWFGPPGESKSFFDYVERVAPDAAPWVRLGWASLEDDFLPIELVFEQMARRFERDGRSYDLEFRAIDDGSALGLVLVVVRDVTERVERERAEQGQREATAVFRRILADRVGFDEFASEGTALVHAIVHDEGAPRAEVMRAIHTLKGIAGIFEIDSVVRFCHEVERRMLEDGGGPTPAEREQIGALWSAVRHLREEIDVRAPVDQVELGKDDHERLLADLESGVGRAALAAFVRSWTEERASARLDRVAGQLRGIARRLGKGDVAIEVHVSPAGLRLPGERWAPIWAAFSHVLRNTIDHGIETRDERIAANKPGAGTVSLSLAADERGVELAICDDGRGIAWDRIRARAGALGLPVATDLDLEDALFADAVSSKDVATEISGRGVGMGAVRQVVRDHGGSISLSTASGRGTSFRLRFPRRMLTDHAATPVSFQEAV